MPPKFPKTMKELAQISQRPRAAPEKVVNASTLDLMYARELERRSTLQQIKPKPQK